MTKKYDLELRIVTPRGSHVSWTSDVSMDEVDHFKVLIERCAKGDMSYIKLDDCRSSSLGDSDRHYTLYLSAEMMQQSEFQVRVHEYDAPDEEA